MNRKMGLSASATFGLGRDAGARAQSSAAQRAPNRPLDRTRRERLKGVIVEQVLPKLKLLHESARLWDEGADAFTPDEISQFGALAVAADSTGARAFFETMQARGHSIETLFIHLLAPTARHLGEGWVQDSCDFLDVTVGVTRLQELLMIFGPAEDVPVIDLRHRILLATAPGEQHVFGVNMVGKLMRGAGWDVTISKGPSVKEIAALVAKDWYGVVGVALSAHAGLEEVGRSIDEMRRVSRNRRIAVMVGGPVFTGHPERAVQVGADSTADDASAAVFLAKKLLLMQDQTM